MCGVTLLDVAIHVECRCSLSSTGIETH